MYPEFPHFKPVEIEDRDFIHRLLWRYQPESSEWTFTNLFIWRFHYRFSWSIYRDCLLVLCRDERGGVYALQPVGPPSRLRVVRMLLHWLHDEKGERDPRIERADMRLISECRGTEEFLIEPTRDHFDYLYRNEDLIHLAGRRYHSKRNHINKFIRSYSFTYDDLSDKYLDSCMELTDRWCHMRRCNEDLNLLGEQMAAREGLSNVHSLHIRGGVILIGNRVEAFTFGGSLNEQTSVVHIEKANPEIQGVYTMINKQFRNKSGQDVLYVNREQDLGESGLRKAKLSYHPVRFVEKFRIRLNEDG